MKLILEKHSWIKIINHMVVATHYINFITNYIWKWGVICLTFFRKLGLWIAKVTQECYDTSISQFFMFLVSILTLNTLLLSYLPFGLQLGSLKLKSLSCTLTPHFKHKMCFYISYPIPIVSLISLLLLLASRQSLTYFNWCQKMFSKHKGVFYNKICDKYD